MIPFSCLCIQLSINSQTVKPSDQTIKIVQAFSPNYTQKTYSLCGNGNQTKNDQKKTKKLFSFEQTSVQPAAPLFQDTEVSLWLETL